MYGNLDYKNTIIKRCCFLHIQCHLDKMTNICHELQYKIWDPLLSRTIICHEIKGHEKIKFKIQVTKAKKKDLSSNNIKIPAFSFTFSPFSLFHLLFISSTLSPYSLLSLCFLSPSQNSQHQQSTQASLIPQPTQTPFSSFSKENWKSFIISVWYGLAR